MFRRLSHTLPKDPEFPADLKGLGYYLNEKDQIRSIARPDHGFNFFISKNDRVNEKQREAINTCIRTNLSSRFTAARLHLTHLPFNPSQPTPPPTVPTIPILTSSHLATAPRLLIYFGESTQDLGILAYRTIDQVSHAAGSILNFVSALHAQSDHPAVIIANCGQLIWYRRGGRAVTQQTWNALPQKTGVDGVMRLDPVRNRVEGHRNVGEHVASVMEFVDKIARKDVKIDIIGMGDASEEVVAYLNVNWSKWEGKVEAVVIGMAYVWFLEEAKQWNERFKEFWGRRARVYLLSSEPIDTPLQGRDNFGCNCYSSGTPSYMELMMPSAYRNILAFFKLVADVPGYAEVEIPDLMEEKDDEEDGQGNKITEMLEDGQTGGLVNGEGGWS